MFKLSQMKRGIGQSVMEAKIQVIRGKTRTGCVSAVICTMSLGQADGPLMITELPSLTERPAIL